MRELDFNDVAIFVQVVERAGFARVARDLEVPTSTVSRAVSRLEEHLGVRLVQRTTRNMQATDDGRGFYAQVAPAMTAVRGAARELEATGRSPHGRLRVSASGDLGATLLPAMIVEFTTRCPDVRVELDLTSRRVNLIDEGFDMAVRAGPLADSSLVARKLCDVDLALYASAGYLHAHGIPTDVAALAQHRCVLFRPKDGQNQWTLEGPDGHTASVTVHGQIGGTDYSFVRAATASGGGIALLPQVIAAAGGASDPLLRVLPDHVQHGAALFVVHPSARQVPARVAALRDFLIEAFARGQAPAAPAARPRRRQA